MTEHALEKEKYDRRRGYCRRLGHDVHFAYCRKTDDGRPCFKIMDCWFEYFDIRAWMTAHYTEEEIQALTKGPGSKVTSLVELIETARRRSKGGDEKD